jgi:hypothetical protein
MARVGTLTLKESNNMSKLDQIEYETYTGTAPQNPDGSYQRITPNTKRQIKDLFLELIGEDDNDHSKFPGAATDEYIEGRDDLRAELRKKVEEL